MVPSKNFAIVSLVTVIAFGLLSFATHINEVRAEGNKAKADKGFAVVDLFTSEGCSSCPPADALIEKIQKESNDQPVYILDSTWITGTAWDGRIPLAALLIQKGKTSMPNGLTEYIHPRLL